jgi:hypothetical protein
MIAVVDFLGFGAEEIHCDSYGGQSPRGYRVTSERRVGGRFASIAEARLLPKWHQRVPFEEMNATAIMASSSVRRLQVDYTSYYFSRG